MSSESQAGKRGGNTLDEDIVLSSSIGEICGAILMIFSHRRDDFIVQSDCIAMRGER